MTHQISISSVYNEYSDSLYAYARHMGFDDDTVMDAIHDVFYKLCISQDSLEKFTNLKFYLFRSLKNRLIDIHRTNREFAGTVSQNTYVYENMEFHFNVTVEDEMIENEERVQIKQKVDEVLSYLTDRQREIIYLRYIHEYSYEEIAELMNISVESCRNSISKSLTKLKNTSLSLPYILYIISGLSY